MDKINEALNQIESGDFYPFHMPGHKRQAVATAWKSIYKRDITEIEGYDNLHHPEGIIAKEQEFAAKVFGAEESFFLINGSSCGVLAALSAVLGTDEGSDDEQKILMNRNAHKSAYHALLLTGASAEYLFPAQYEKIPFSGGIEAEAVKEALEKDSKQAFKAVFVTSPTYEGVVSDIQRICEAAHVHGIPVIVDEAHGAHLGIFGGDGDFPESAVRQGADMVIQSLHKTLPAMTQTAVLHVQGNLVDRNRLKLFLGIFQSSSPSYVLMNSISDCIHTCHEQKKELVFAYKYRLNDFYKETAQLKNVQVITASKGMRKDPGKLIISAGKCGLNGNALSGILRDTYHLEMEMASGDYVIAMTSVMDTGEGFRRLADALKEIDVKYGKTDAVSLKSEYINLYDVKVEKVYTLKDTLVKKGEDINLTECVGRISKEFIYLYPPGIPLVVPGERMNREVIDLLQRAMRMGLSVQGPADYTCKKVQCVIEI